MPPHILNLDDMNRQSGLTVVAQPDELRPHAQLQVFCPLGRGHRLGQGQRRAGDNRLAARDLAGQDIHARRADEITDEGMGRPFKKLLRRPHLHHLALVHHHHFVREGQGFGLIVGHINHGVIKFAVQMFELGAQLPFKVRVDHRQRLVEKNGRHV